MRTLDALYRHSAWAEAMIWTAVFAHDAATTDSLIQERLGHTHMVEWIYLQTWRGDEVDAHLGTQGDAKARMHWGRAYHRAVAEFLSTLDECRLGDAFAFPFES